MTAAARRRPDVWTAAIVLGWVTVAVLLLYPLSSVLRASLIDNDTGGWTLANYAAVLARPRYSGRWATRFWAAWAGWRAPWCWE